MKDKRTTNFKFWNGDKWVKGKGLINESLLCACPGCRKKPFKAANSKQKKYCCIDCRTKHNRQILGKLVTSPPPLPQ